MNTIKTKRVNVGDLRFSDTILSVSDDFSLTTGTFAVTKIEVFPTNIDIPAGTFDTK